jgi:hypothetical protein
MGKLNFSFGENGELIIKDCDFIHTDPKKCEECQHRFECFTERKKASKAVLSSAVFPKFDDLLKHMTLEFDEPKED